MRNRIKQKENRKKYKAREWEEARWAGMDNFIGNRSRYRDPTAAAAIEAADRAARQKVRGTEHSTDNSTDNRRHIA